MIHDTRYMIHDIVYNVWVFLDVTPEGVTCARLRLAHVTPSGVTSKNPHTLYTISCIMYLQLLSQLISKGKKRSRQEAECIYRQSFCHQI